MFMQKDGSFVPSFCFCNFFCVLQVICRGLPAAGNKATKLEYREFELTVSWKSSNVKEGYPMARSESLLFITASLNLQIIVDKRAIFFGC